VTIVRIVLADPRTGRVPEGSAVNGQQLIVLADDAGHRAVPLWLRVIDAKLLWGLLERSAGDAVMAGVLEETAARLLHAAGVGVTAVDIEPAGGDVPELRPGTAAARVGLATAAGDRHARVSAGYGLKLAVVAGVPVRVADAVMDRLAVPVHGEDVHAPFLLPAADRTPGRPGQLRTTGVAGHAGLHLAAGRPDQPPGALLCDRGGSSLAGPGSGDWTRHEVTVPVPEQAGVIRFGISLTGRGRVELRNPELTSAPEAQE
jgi:hypothetical protein